MKKISLLLILLSLTSLCSFAQKGVFEGIETVYLHNLGPITEGNEVSGYYLFYRTDRLGKGNYGYELAITDQNMNKLTSKQIIGSKHLLLLEGNYNKEGLLLKFYDGKEKEVIFRQYDKKANEIKVDRREVNRYEKAQYMQQLQNPEGSINPSLFSIEKTGFVDYSMDKFKKIGYTITFFPTAPGYKKWVYNSDEESRDIQVATFIYGNENILISSVLTKSNLLSKKIDVKLLILDTKTGKKILEKDIADEKYELLVTNGLESDNEGSIYLFGSYFDKGDKEMSSASKGLFSLELDMKGNIKNKKFNSWEKEISTFLPVDKKGKMKDVGYFYFHEIVKDADGNIYAVGENYRKQVSASGVAINMLAAAAGGRSNTAMVEMAVEDLVIFEFSKDFSLKKVNIIEKDITRVNLPAGSNINGPHILAHYIKAYGGFDYAFLQKSNDESTITVTYVDWVRIKGEKNRDMVGTANYTDGEFSLDVIDINPEGTGNLMGVLPAKTGNVTIVEYDKKEKKILFRIEKINR